MHVHTLIRVFASIVFMGVLAFTGMSVARAQQDPDIYPIADLGYCSSQSACASYCENPAHKAACWSYAQHVGVPDYVSGEVAGETTDDETNSSNNALQNVTFPVEELGGCANVRECRAYCNNPEHFDMCTSFGEEHGLLPPSQRTLLQHAKAELDCSSMRACRVFCNAPEHAQQCIAFAEKYAPKTLNMRMRSLLQDAEDALGCSDITSCRRLCNQQHMKLRCHQFARHHKHESSTSGDAYSDLPCDTYQSCKEFCSLPENATRCSVTSMRDGQVRINVRETDHYTCESNAECERWCRNNPTKCPGYMDSDAYQAREAERERRNSTSNSAEDAIPDSDKGSSEDGVSTIDIPSGEYQSQRTIYPPGEPDEDVRTVEIEWQETEDHDDTHQSDDFGQEHSVSSQ